MRLFLVYYGFLSFSAAAAQTPFRPDSVSDIQLSASATRTVPPDLAIIRFGVTSDRGRAAEAGQANAQVVAAMRESFRALGITLDTTSMTGYSVQPRRDREQRITGYTARSEINVVLHDLSRLGDAIDAALAAGATDVSPLNFVASSLQAARDSAYVAAVRTLYHNATTIVTAAGGRLVGSARLAVSEQQARVPCASCTEVVIREPTTFLPGLVAITVNVSGTFHFVAR